MLDPSGSVTSLPGLSNQAVFDVACGGNGIIYFTEELTNSVWMFNTSSPDDPPEVSTLEAQGGALPSALGGYARLGSLTFCP